MLLDVTSTFTISKGLMAALEASPLLGCFAYALHWIRGRMESAEAARETLRVEKDNQIKAIYEEKESKINELREQYQKVVTDAQANERANSIALQLISFALNDLADNTSDSNDNIVEIKRLVSQLMERKKEGYEKV